MIDAVLSYHDRPETCGVTKFNMQLAEHLGVPHDSVFAAVNYAAPLLSLKASECADLRAIQTTLESAYTLLWHDRDPRQAGLTSRASAFWYADELGCPSTVRGNARRPGLTVLTLGMAHKTQFDHFTRLKTLLDARGGPYTVCVSAAMHEGSPWHKTTTAHTAQLRDLFGEHLRWLGFLADDALARELREAHMVALFYAPAVRANNTTLWAALEAGTPVITNLDAQSPADLVHERSVFDLAQMTEWPEANLLREVRHGGSQIVAAHGWPALLEKLQVVTA